jgi:hypothetical protein
LRPRSQWSTSARHSLYITAANNLISGEAMGAIGKKVLVVAICVLVLVAASFTIRKLVQSNVDRESAARADAGVQKKKAEAVIQPPSLSPSGASKDKGPAKPTLGRSTGCGKSATGRGDFARTTIGVLGRDLACRRGDVLRASAAVAGGFWSGKCKGKVAVWFVHDTDDKTVPIAQGREARDRVLASNGCSTNTVDEGDGCVRYKGCGASPVVWCQSSGIGHSPRGDFAPPRVWKFFSELP